MEIAKLDSNSRLYIPSDILKQAGLSKDDRLAIIPKNGFLVIAKVLEVKTAYQETYQVQEEKTSKPISQQKAPEHFKGITEDQKYEIMDLCQKLDIEPPWNMNSFSYEYANTYIRDLRNRLSSRREQEPASDAQKEYIRKLKEKAGEEIIEEELESLTKKEAHEEIDRLKNMLGMK